MICNKSVEIVFGIIIFKFNSSSVLVGKFWSKSGPAP